MRENDCVDVVVSLYETVVSGVPKHMVYCRGGDNKTHPLVVRGLANRIVRRDSVLGMRTGREENLIIRDGRVGARLPCGDIVHSKFEEVLVVETGGPGLGLRLVSVKRTNVRALRVICQ